MLGQGLESWGKKEIWLDDTEWERERPVDESEQMRQVECSKQARYMLSAQKNFDSLHVRYT